MIINKKLYSVALVSAALILFLFFVSFTASAQTESEITSEVENTSDGQVMSDEVPTEFDGIATESVQSAALKITEKRITTNDSNQVYPKIYGNIIVWEDERNENHDIYMYNLSTSKETRITVNSSDQYDPDVYGNRIVWEDWRNDDTNSNGDIYMYDLSTSKEIPLITNDDSSQRCPAIYGDKIVWMDWGRGDEDVSDIYMYDLSTSTETRLPTHGMAYNPDIYGNRIVWEEERDDNYDIYMYDLSTSTETKITTNWANQLNPAIYGDRIVWEDWRNDDDSGPISDIYMYDLSTKKETQITNGKSNSQYPAIYGNRIVWEDDRNGNWDIYVYDLATHQQTRTTEASAQLRPNIYGDKIVWEDVRNGNYDIYMGTLSSTTFPVASFSASLTSGKAPLNVKFTDTSTGTPTKWQWNFGDGSKSFLKNPTHKYSKAGIYTVSLTVKNAAGSNTLTKKDYIKIVTKPVASFSASPTSGKVPLKVQFTDKSTGFPTSWKWTFGDGTTSTKQNPTHKYSKAGKYTVSLTVKNAMGSNTVTKTEYIKVITKPVANFTSSVTSGKAPLNVAFTDTSTGIPATWIWNFGDGSKSYLQNPTHKYSKAGKYTVSLTVKNAAGSNTKTMSNYITV